MNIDIIIIVTFKRAELLKRAVDSMLSARRGRDCEFMIIIVDNI